MLTVLALYLRELFIIVLQLYNNTAIITGHLISAYFASVKLVKLVTFLDIKQPYL